MEAFNICDTDICDCIRRQTASIRQTFQHNFHPAHHNALSLLLLPIQNHHAYLQPKKYELPPEPQNRTFFTPNYANRTNYPPRPNPRWFWSTWRTCGSPVSILFIKKMWDPHVILFLSLSSLSQSVSLFLSLSLTGGSAAAGDTEQRVTRRRRVTPPPLPPLSLSLSLSLDIATQEATGGRRVGAARSRGRR